MRSRYCNPPPKAIRPNTRAVHACCGDIVFGARTGVHCHSTLIENTRAAPLYGGIACDRAAVHRQDRVCVIGDRATFLRFVSGKVTTLYRQHTVVEYSAACRRVLAAGNCTGLSFA